MSPLSPSKRSEIMLANITESDCAVIALQAVAALDRENAMAVAIQLGGYREGSGMWRHQMKNMYIGLGFTLSPQPVARESIATFALKHEYGRYLLFTKAHVCPLIDGDLFNMKDTRAPLEDAWEATPPPSLTLSFPVAK